MPIKSMHTWPEQGLQEVERGGQQQGPGSFSILHMIHAFPKSMQTGPNHELQVLREVERAGERAKVSDGRGADLEYLKNILLKMYETGEAHAQPAVQ